MGRPCFQGLPERIAGWYLSTLEGVSEQAEPSNAAWLYFIAANADGTPRLIVRRNLVQTPTGNSSWGPVIQLLTRDWVWIDRPQLLTRFWDPGYLEQVTPAEAREAAQEREIQRLVEEEGLSENEARVLATERWLDVPLGLDGKALVPLPPAYTADFSPTVATDAKETPGRELEERKAKLDAALARLKSPQDDPADPDPSFPSPELD